MTAALSVAGNAIPCSPAVAGPTVHRQVAELAQAVVARLQIIDDSGYSGHLSYILHMLGSEKFQKVYRAGGFKPEDVMVFGKRHQIVINRMVTADKR